MVLLSGIRFGQLIHRRCAVEYSHRAIDLRIHVNLDGCTACRRTSELEMLGESNLGLILLLKDVHHLSVLAEGKRRKVCTRSAA